MTYAQFGEDLLIDDLFQKIGIENQWCFEVGAHNGRYCSNTLLFRERGWKAILAEQHDRHFEALSSDYGDSAICVHQTVASLDDLLFRNGAPLDIDLGVIDVDGNDYWLWSDMTEHKPRVLLVEYSPYANQPGYDPINPQPRNGMQTARQPTVELGKAKGYRLIGETYCNLLFAL